MSLLQVRMGTFMTLVPWGVEGNAVVGTMTLHSGYVGTEGLHILKSGRLPGTMNRRPA